MGINAETEQAAAVAREFIPGTPSSVTRIGTGHIHRTFLVASSGKKYVLQHLNNHVFPDIDGLMANFELILTHMAARRSLTWLEPPELVRTTSGAPFLRTPEGDTWRSYHYIEGITHSTPESTDIVRAAASATAEFHRVIEDIPTGSLVETIKFFHDTARRWKAFTAALESDPHNRASSAKQEIDFAVKRTEIATVITSMLESGEIPLRVAHNDTKLNNYLFDAESGRAKSVIDLDTVMAGSALYDLGDLVRSAVCRSAEDEHDTSRIRADMALFEALAQGYLEKGRTFLTPAEISLFVFAGRLITFETGLRFLTDHLNGDVYFRIERPGHNLDRCASQFALVKSIEDNQDAMDQIVKKLT